MQVTIRPLREEDAYTSVKWRNDPEVFKYTGNTYNHEIKIDSELNWIHNVIANNEAGIDYRCAIEADGVYVGNIYITGIENGSAEYHIFIGDKDYWGKGIAKDASFLILRYAFETLKLENVKLEVKAENINALNLYKRLGFQEVERHGDWIVMKITPPHFNKY